MWYIVLLLRLDPAAVIIEDKMYISQEECIAASGHFDDKIYSGATCKHAILIAIR